MDPSCKEGGPNRKAVIEAARGEIAIRKFFDSKGAKAFTTNFDALHGMDQLPELACQRVMASVLKMIGRQRHLSGLSGS